LRNSSQNFIAVVNAVGRNFRSHCFGFNIQILRVLIYGQGIFIVFLPQFRSKLKNVPRIIFNFTASVHCGH
jgi:hypothetical protein